MNGELVFTVNGAKATAAKPIGLAAAGLRERDHLQEWVIEHPEVLGSAVKIVAFEFGSWTGHTGAKEHDRLDILALDGDGHLIVVELKRDKAPDTVEMQALKYAALVSRFTRDDLDQVHARYLSKSRNDDVSVEDAASELDAWAEISEESLRLPNIVLMATDFPQTVTATVVFLHQQLGLNIKLLVFQAYQTANDVLVTVSQHYPPAGIEEFVLTPEVDKAQRAKTGKQNKQRESNTVARLIAADVLQLGEKLTFKAPSLELQAELADWLDAAAGRRIATWQDDPTAPLIWEADGLAYTPTGLARLILNEGAGRLSAVQGPNYWVAESGQTLVELAGDAPLRAEVSVDTHTAKMSTTLRPLWDELDAAILALGPNVNRQSRVRGFKYYGSRKLCDITVHGDHLSVYIQGLSIKNHPQSADNVIFGGTERYVHTQLRNADELSDVLVLLEEGLATQ